MAEINFEFLTDLEAFLTDLEAKARAAEDTAIMRGPWTREWNDRDDHDAGIDIIDADGQRVTLVEHMEADDGEPLTNDVCRVADHIAAAHPAAVLALVAEVRRMRGERDELHRAYVHSVDERDKTEAALRRLSAKLRYGPRVEADEYAEKLLVSAGLWRDPKEARHG